MNVQRFSNLIDLHASNLLSLTALSLNSALYRFVRLARFALPMGHPLSLGSGVY